MAADTFHESGKEFQMRHRFLSAIVALAAMLCFSRATFAQAPAAPDAKSANEAGQLTRAVKRLLNAGKRKPPSSQGGGPKRSRAAAR